MNIAVLGAGALGSAFAALLSEAGEDVVLISQRSDHVDRINAEGLTVLENGNARKVNLRAHCGVSTLGQVDLLIVLVKSRQTKQSIEFAKEIVGPNTTVISLQNGVGNEEIISQSIAKEHLIGGRTYIGSLAVGPEEIAIGTEGKSTIIGEFDGSQSQRVVEISAVFNRARIDTKVSENVTGIIWDKLLVNVATGPLCAATGLPYGELYKIPEIEECALGAVSEGIAIADVLGVQLSVRDGSVIWNSARQRLAPDFKASMLQSIEAGQLTEIDFINGAICSLGRKYGLATPINDTLVAIVKGIERRIGLAE